MPLQLTPSFRERLAASSRPQIGMWLCSGSPLVAEICAGSGLDWLLVDAEHGPNTLDTILPQLQAIAAYPIAPVVRVPAGEPVLVKQFLDLGVQNLLVPQVDTAEQARAIVASTRYPPRGIRGVGSALSRGARWNRVEGYLQRAEQTLSIFVQIESAEAVENAAELIAVDGVDGVFLGPSDLAASMGLLGRQEHPSVVASVERCIAVARRLGKPAGVNAFSPELARRYLDAGASWILVGADVSILARSSEALARDWIAQEQPA